MKITICGSSKFRNEKMDMYNQLLVLWHDPIIDENTKNIVNGAMEEYLVPWVEDADIKKKYDFIRLYYNFIVESDAIIVCNYDKGDVKHYIGSNTFLEMGYAHVHHKKIFLLHGMPQQSYILDELKAMDPIIINWDLSLI